MATSQRSFSFISGVYEGRETSGTNELLDFMVPEEQRFCLCGTRLAKRNPEIACFACQRKSLERKVARGERKAVASERDLSWIDKALAMRVG